MRDRNAANPPWRAVASCEGGSWVACRAVALAKTGPLKLTIWKLFRTGIRARTTSGLAQTTASKHIHQVNGNGRTIYRDPTSVESTSARNSDRVHRRSTNRASAHHFRDRSQISTAQAGTLHTFYLPPKTRAKERPRSNAWFMGPAELEMTILLWTAAK